MTTSCKETETNSKKSTKCSKVEKTLRKRKKKKSTYKHVPHAEKPQHLVEKRNARERRRVHAVNLAFVRLRKAMPIENKVENYQKLLEKLEKNVSYHTDESKDKV